MITEKKNTEKTAEVQAFSEKIIQSKKKPGDKGYRRSRLEQMFSTSQDNRILFDRHSPEYKRKRAVRLIAHEGHQYFNTSKCLIMHIIQPEKNFNSSIYKLGPLDNFRVPSNDSLFIYIYPSNNTKSVKRVYTKKRVSSNWVPTTIWGQQPAVVKTVKNEIDPQKHALITHWGAKHRSHFYQQTLKLHAYPLSVLEYGLSQYQLSIDEKIRINRPFGYMTKILDVEMERRGLQPNWRNYYQALAVYGFKKQKGKVMMENDSQPRYDQSSLKNKSSSSGEQSSPYKPIPKPETDEILIKFAKRYLKEARERNKSSFYIKSNMQNKIQDYPRAVSNFKRWLLHESDGQEFRKLVYTDQNTEPVKEGEIV